MSEFSRFSWQSTVPDPGEPATFLRSRLNHALASAPRHRELREYYRTWLALRRRHRALGAHGKQRTRATFDPVGAIMTIDREGEAGELVRLIVNLTADRRRLGPLSPEWRVVLDSADPRFAGPGERAPLGPWQALLLEAAR